MAQRRESRDNRRIGKVQAPPPKDHQQMQAFEVFIALKESGDWTDGSLCEELSEITDNPQLDINTIKSWGRTTNAKIPVGQNRDALFELILSNCAEHVNCQEWVQALTESWVRKRRGTNKTTGTILNRESAALVQGICQRVLDSPYIARLPALFESNPSLPIASAYVDLNISPASPIGASPTLLELNLSLTEKLEKRMEQRYAIRRSPKDCLDIESKQSTLILGPPGAGKSSLLRRIALDIASGKWNSANIPFFVEARIYWANRKSDSLINLLRYAIKRALPKTEDEDLVNELILNSDTNQKPILLVDGLDEIASDPEAVSIIYDDLKQLSKSVSWIATSRPAGLMASPGESQRFELVELDEDAIEQLIDKWLEAETTNTKGFNAEGLKLELLGSPNMRQLAGNPFLLTALCYLKSFDPDNKLPESQIAVYEALFERISFQARKRDSRVLTPEALDNLRDFCYYLYDQEDGNPIQVFGLSLWQQFKLRTKVQNSVDFEKNILPSRLLTAWGEADPYYHFLHLSLQEYLVACAMLDYPVEEALNKRFLPGWRSAFRYYGALLYLRGRTREFRTLTKTLYEEEDFNRFSLLILVDIFSCAGIRNTSKWIGEDLLVELEAGSMAGFESGSNAMLYALAELDPARLEKIACDEIDQLDRIYNAPPDNEHYIYPGQDLINVGKTPSSPFEKLARARTPSAKQTLSDSFWGDNQKLSLMATSAYALVATPSERAQIVKAAGDVVIFNDQATRFFAFALCCRRPEFLPFLRRVINHFSASADGPYQEVINLVADIGGQKGAAILEELINTQSNQIVDNNTEALEVCLDAIVRMGGSEAEQLLVRAAGLPQLAGWQPQINSYRIGVNPSDNTVFQKILSDNTGINSAVSALSQAALFGRIPSDAVALQLKKHLSQDLEQNVLDICLIEMERLDAGRPPVFCEYLLEFAIKLYSSHPSREISEEYLISTFSLIFETLGRGPYEPAIEFVQSMLFSEDIDDDLLTGAIDLAGRLLSGTSDSVYLSRLKELLFDPDGSDPQVVALAIGRIDLEHLYRLQNAIGASDAIEQIAAEKDIMIFEKFWVDRSGTQTKWKNPPKKVLYIYDTDRSDMPQIFSHEMSRYGLCFDANDIDNAIACLVFGNPAGDYEKTLEQSAKNLKRQDSAFPIFSISEEMTKPEAQNMANRIGIELLTQLNS